MGLIEDITESPIFIGSDSLDVLLNEGVRSVQSTPLVSRSGKFQAFISTYFNKVQTLSERKLMLIDILARQTTDPIEHERGKHMHRRSGSYAILNQRGVRWRRN